VPFVSDPIKKKPSSLRLRITSALVLAPLVLGAVYWGGWPFNILIGLMVLILASEWSRIVGKRVGWMMFGLFYITFTCWAVWRLRMDPEWGRLTMFWLLAVVWGADIGGFVFGLNLGGPKLAPRISPNKTWSGFLGGTLTAAVGGWAVVYFVLNGADYQVGWHIAAFSAAIAVVSQMGDLFESSIKRRFDVKDSGTIIPGHGGMFDRVDGLLAAALVTAFITLSAEGNVLIWMS
jgi:phosphatidate cytidylyltransferase